MRNNESIYVICPDQNLMPIIKKRRLSLEIAEYGCSRRSFRSRALAEEAIELEREAMHQQWRFSNFPNEFDLVDQGVLLDVAHALKRGRTIRIT